MSASEGARAGAGAGSVAWLFPGQGAQQVGMGAHFGESGGWERPRWYAANEPGAPGFARRSGWEAVEWSPAAAAEHVGTRE